MNVIPHIFYPLLLGIPIFIYAFFKFPRYAIAGLIIAKPIIDLTWDYHILLDINFLKLYAGLFVILGVIYIIVKRVPILSLRHSAKNSPHLRFSVSPFHFLNILWLIFLGLNFISIFIISDAHLLLGKINYFLRILTGFIALIIFAHLFDFEKDKKFVLSIFIIAGIFPILLWLIPVIIGNPILSNDELSRIMGPYQNFWNFNFYATQTLICCLAYLSLKDSSFSYLLKRIASKLRILPSSRHCEERSEGVAISSSPGVEPLGSSKSASSFRHCEERSDEAISTLPVIASVARQSHLFRRSSAFRLVRRVIIYLMILISVAMVYKCYSKAGWITLVTILFVWFLLRKKIIQTVLIPVIAAVILFVNPFARDFQKTFDNEIDYFLHNTSNKEIVFRGRLKTLENILDRQRTLPVKNQLFGAKTSIDYSGSDFSMILWNNGFSGIILYTVLLSLTGYLLIRKYARKEVPIVLASILVFVIYALSSFGTHPLLIPNFQWLMWGMVGFILSKDTVSSKQYALCSLRYSSCLSRSVSGRGGI